MKLESVQDLLALVNTPALLSPAFNSSGDVQEAQQGSHTTVLDILRSAVACVSRSQQLQGKAEALRAQAHQLLMEAERVGEASNIAFKYLQAREDSKTLDFEKLAKESGWETSGSGFSRSNARSYQSVETAAEACFLADAHPMRKAFPALSFEEFQRLKL